MKGLYRKNFHISNFSNTLEKLNIRLNALYDVARTAYLFDFEDQYSRWAYI